MVSETVNAKINNNATKNSLKETDVITKKDVDVSKKDATIGLRVPGSNWQRFKNLIAETSTNEQSSNNSEFKKKISMKKKHYYKHSRKNAEHTCISNVNQIANTKEPEKNVQPQNLLTRAVALDCEMVGIGDGTDSMLARVSIVNRNGICIYDKYVKPTEEIVDYRTPVSGIRPHHLTNGEDFKKIQKEVSEILKGRILVGHGLHNDLSVLFLTHPKRSQRDTSRYKLFRKITLGNTPSLKKLASELLGVDVQSGEHNSIEDARTAMQIYQLFRKKWENEIRKK
ncbi:RNA exonuclease 4 [Phymastichus coffea]|uniref:RNA exonuclease 4 n=1 Tax=Phymastichus coffea TaxID=108790 RepID=UPI00273CDF85|nr:RNA exonuclease 4 [Phymastichus coffea]